MSDKRIICDSIEIIKEAGDRYQYKKYEEEIFSIFSNYSMTRNNIIFLWYSRKADEW